MTIDKAISYEERNVEINKLIGEVSDCEPTNAIAYHQQLVEWLKELKRLREQTRWIPVSERLPENSGNYLITYYYRDEIETQEAVYVEGEENKWYDTTDIEITLAVIAWMPLPEPYKVESEDKE